MVVLLVVLLVVDDRIEISRESWQRGSKEREREKRKGWKLNVHRRGGVLTSLASGRLIAQSRIIRGFRVTKPRRGGLYQLESARSVRGAEEEGKREKREGEESRQCPALVHLVVTSVKRYRRPLKGRPRFSDENG